MRGRREPQVSMLAFIDLETRVPAGHPLRTIKGLADRALAQLSPEFDRMYAQIGRLPFWPSLIWRRGCQPVIPCGPSRG